VSLTTRSTAAILALLLDPLAACGSDRANPRPAAPAASQAPTTSAPSAVETTPSPTAEQRTAEKVFEDISAKVDSASLTTVYDEESDPNELLGRPNGYTSKVAFADSRVKFDEYEEQGLTKDDLTRGDSGGGCIPSQGSRSISSRPDVLGSRRRDRARAGHRKLRPTAAKTYEAALR
jgi:hypothetical protein